MNKIKENILKSKKSKPTAYYIPKSFNFKRYIKKINKVKLKQNEIKNFQTTKTSMNYLNRTRENTIGDVFEKPILSRISNR